MADQEAQSAKGADLRKDKIPVQEPAMSFEEIEAFARRCERWGLFWGADIVWLCERVKAR